jgi:hypothetical protein
MWVTVDNPAILNMVQGQTAKAVTIRPAVLKEEGILLERTPGKVDLCGLPMNSDGDGLSIPGPPA